MTLDPAPDPRLSSPSALRNRQPILDVLGAEMPAGATILELASGTGEHAAWFARARSDIRWLPSDPDAAARASIAAHTADLPNVEAPRALDVLGDGEWPDAGLDGMVAINLIHISPWEVTPRLMARAADLLAPEGFLFLYGPYRSADRPLEPGNAAFDESLKARDPRWGLRTVEAVTAEAEQVGLRLARAVDMPADNRSLLFRRQARSPRG